MSSPRWIRLALGLCLATLYSGILTGVLCAPVPVPAHDLQLSSSGSHSVMAKSAPSWSGSLYDLDHWEHLQSRNPGKRKRTSPSPDSPSPLKTGDLKDPNYRPKAKKEHYADWDHGTDADHLLETQAVKDLIHQNGGPERLEPSVIEELKKPLNDAKKKYLPPV